MSIFSKKDKIKDADNPAAEQARYGAGKRVGADIRVNPRRSALFMKQPWVTEKAGDLGALGKYIFIVDRKINKSEVKKAVESIYGVKVENINIISIKGKAKRLGRSLGKTSSFKKAIVTLKQGQKIDIMPT